VGFPCPEALTVATRVHGMTVTAETEMPGGNPLPTEAGVALCVPRIPSAALTSRVARPALRP
jgi:hypothetical protein